MPAPPHTTSATALLPLALFTACKMVPAPEPERLLDLHPATADATALPTELDVLVWNIKKTQKPDWRTELEKLDASAELMLLQEGYQSAVFGEVVEASTDEWRMGVSFHYLKDRGARKLATGVVTAAPVRATSATVQHSPTREPFVPTPKAVLLTGYPLTGSEETLLVVNVHAINFRRASHLEKQLEALRRPIAEHVGPVILAGDFNTHHAPRLKVLESFAAQLGLTAVFPNWTTNRRGKRRLAKDDRMRHAGYPLDHVYVRGLTVSDAKVHGDAKGSDHVPLTFRVSR